MQIHFMKTSVYLDDELASEVKKTTSLAGEDQPTILRMAIRAGLPVLANCFQAPRPEVTSEALTSGATPKEKSWKRRC
jgi:hypothetical protein